MRNIFDGETDLLGAVTQLTTATILDRLHAIEEAAWGDWFGKPLNARGLALLLAPWSIKSRKWRAGEETQRGYIRADFVDAWRRYLEPYTPSPQTPHPPPRGEAAGHARGGSVAHSDSVSATRSDQHKHGPVADVAGVAAGDLGRAGDCCPDCGWALDSQGHVGNCEGSTS